MTVISTDGASELTKQVPSNVEQGMAIANNLTGLDLGGMFTALASRAGATSEDGPPPPLAEAAAAKSKSRRPASKAPNDDGDA